MMAAMACLFPPLPVFLDLIGRSVVVAAGDLRAAAFARACLEAGAGVSVIHPAPCEAIQQMGPHLRILLRRWRAADFRHASVVAVGADERRPGPARASAKTAKAIFLMLDGSAQSDVALGEVAARGPLTLGIATIGLPGPLAEALRDRIEAAAPHALTGFLEAAARAGDLAGGGLDPAGRRRFWKAALAAAAKARPDGWAPADWDDWLSRRIEQTVPSQD